MLKNQRSLMSDPVARRGRTLYEKKIKRKVARGNKGRIVAIDLKSQDYEVADEVLPAYEALHARHPDARMWFERIGYDAVDRFASWNAAESAG
ncbi:MAG TPA: hypothetical protein VGN88_06545 [Phycisphaerae bacterium]